MATPSKIIDEVWKVVRDASWVLKGINDGTFMLRTSVPQKYQFPFEVFKQQLKNETFDFEGLRLRLEFYYAWKDSDGEDCDTVWKWCFGENYKEDEFWEHLRLGFGYLLNCILPGHEDMPVLAGKFLPFCTTYNCGFKRGGCLFSICEDILGIIELLPKCGFERYFKKEVLKYFGDGLINTLYKPIHKILNDNCLLPTHFAVRRSDGDPYITLKAMCHLTDINLYPTLTLSNATKEKILEQAITNPASKLYSPHGRTKVLSDDSPLLKIKLAELLLKIPDFSQKREGKQFIETQLTRAISILTKQNIGELIGPSWGRDRYSSIAWSSHTDIATVINAIQFILEILNKKFAAVYNDQSSISTALLNGIKYLLKAKNKNNTWPVVSIDAIKEWKPTKKVNNWDCIKNIDSKITDCPEIFNISFSNTIEVIIIFLKSIPYLNKIQGGSEKND